MSGRPQMDSKGAVVMLAFMGGVSVGLVDKTWVCATVAVVLVCMAVWQYRLEDRP